MSVHAISYRDGAKMMRPVLSREEYMALRDSQRNLTAGKRDMVQMNYSCLPTEGGALRGATLPSDSVGMDIDFDPTVPGWEMERQRTEARVAEKKEELGLLMLERSAGKGLHVVFRRRPGMTQEENLMWASRTLGVDYDKGAKDITRVFFTPPSEGHLLFLDPDIFTVPGRAEAEAENTATPTAAEGESAAREGTAADEREATPVPAPDTYNGIPYSDIVERWWDFHNGGQTPVRSNRNTLTYELAVNLRHICGFDRQLLDRVIPCYDGFPEAEKLACIDSALGEKRTQMPRRLKDVLQSLREDRQDSTREEDAAKEDTDGDHRTEVRTAWPLPPLPQGIRDSVDAVGPALALPVIMAVCPVIGALATGVRLDIHGKKSGLNLITYIAGDFASGKGSIDPVVGAWTEETRLQDKVYLGQEEAWRSRKRAAKNKKEQPEEPKFPVRCLTLNNTVANLAERLANTRGKHAFSFTPEADTVAQKWRTAMSDFSVMLRQAYDGVGYEREARSADAVSVHIDRLLWNVVMCGTPDALYRVVTNYTDGFQSRLAIARTPDNTFDGLDECLHSLKPRHTERIRQIAHLLPLMEGEVTLRKLEARGREWLEAVRLETMENDDRTKARQRFRICPTSMRMTTCILLCKVASQLIARYGAQGAETRLRENPTLWADMLQTLPTQAFAIFDTLADYMMDNALHFFRDRIEAAFRSTDYRGSTARTKRSRNDTIFSRLPQKFTFGEAYSEAAREKGADVTSNSVYQMLKNWKRQSLIVSTAKCEYIKTGQVA